MKANLLLDYFSNRFDNWKSIFDILITIRSLVLHMALLTSSVLCRFCSAQHQRKIAIYGIECSKWSDRINLLFASTRPVTAKMWNAETLTENCACTLTEIYRTMSDNLWSVVCFSITVMHTTAFTLSSCVPKKWVNWLLKYLNDVMSNRVINVYGNGIKQIFNALICKHMDGYAYAPIHTQYTVHTNIGSPSSQWQQQSHK